jgi:hypothetical protein
MGRRPVLFIKKQNLRTGSYVHTGQHMIYHEDDEATVT